MSVTPLRTVRSECHATTVSLLRLLLERAEAGEVIGMTVAIDCGDPYESISTADGKAPAIGMLAMAKMSILEEE